MNALDLKKIREKAGNLTQKEMAERLGIKTRTYQNYELTGDIPEYMQKLIRYSFFDDTKHEVNEPKSNYSDLTKPLNSKVLEVPLVHQYAYAGYMSGFTDDEYISELPTVPFIVESKVYKGNYLAFEVKGDSMDDRSIEAYPERTIILCREIPKQHWVNKLHISQWDFVIVHQTEGVLLKRIKEHNTENGDLLLHSLNDLYEDFTVNLNEVVKIFNVVKKIVTPSL